MVPNGGEHFTGVHILFKGVSSNGKGLALKNPQTIID